MARAIGARVEDGVLTVHANEQMLLQARGEVLLGDGHRLRTPHLSLSFDVTDRPDGIVVRLRFRNDERAGVRVEQLRPLVAERGLFAAPLDELRILQCGWQSWSRAHPSAPFQPNLEAMAPPIRGPYLPYRRADSQVEPWMTVLLVGPDALLLGFVDGHEQLGTIEVAPEGAGHSVCAATELDGVLLPAGSEVLSAPLLLATGDETDLVARYAAAAAETMRARPQPEVLSGWCSWYQLYTSVSEADVDRNLASLAAERERVPLQLIQLDDGYQRAVGDWLHLNEKFPSGMPALVERIARHGYVPGLWLAPFLLSERSTTYAQHPDWVVRDEHGAPLNAISNWGAANFALDTTHPAALTWLQHVIDTVCNGWGYAYLKLDFLYAGAMRGRRFDRQITGVQAYRRGLEALRRVAGDRFILGCGAPLVPSIGLVDGMRIGTDVAAYWGDEGNSDGPSLLNATRATLARLWMHGRWWTNDPDCVVIRGRDSDLNLPEVQAWLGVVALSGGMLFVGDDVSRVESERLDLLSRLIPPSGEAAVADGPLVALMPQRLVLRVRRAWAEWSVVGVANWSDSLVSAVFALRDSAPAAERYHVVDLWSGAYLGLFASDAVDLGELAPHAMRLLAVHPDLGRPQTIGSTGHLLGDAMDLASEEWDPTAHVLTLRPSANGPSARHGEFLVYDPHGPLRRVPLSAARNGVPIHVPFG
jgi:alpha-galactosidase